MAEVEACARIVEEAAFVCMAELGASARIVEEAAFVSMIKLGASARSAGAAAERETILLFFCRCSNEDIAVNLTD
jgi:hypothetical protein